MDGFRILYLGGLLAVSGWRLRYGRAGTRRTVRRSEPLDWRSAILMAGWGLSQLAALLYCLTDRLAWADYAGPRVLRWLGALLFVGSLALLWRSHVELGAGWSPKVQVHENHALVTTGVYRFVRHPMYAAHLLWAMGQAMMLSNWLAGPPAVVVMGLFCWVRITREEAFLLEHFGDAYRCYMRRTGCLWPRRRSGPIEPGLTESSRHP